MEAFRNNFLKCFTFLFVPQDSGLWKVDVKIERIDGLPLTSGKCQNATNAQDPDYGNFSAILPTPRRYVLMLPSVCMEKDVAYVVKVTYSRDESNRDGVGSILTDAVSYLTKKVLVVSCSRDLDREVTRLYYVTTQMCDYSQIRDETECVTTRMRHNPDL